MKEIDIIIDKETLEVSLDFQGYQGMECLTDYNDLLNALKVDEGHLTMTINKYQEVENERLQTRI